MERPVDKLMEQLKEGGYKLTPQRRATLNVIIENKGKHLNTEEIYNLVKEKCPEIGLATVYRTLQLFDDLRLIAKINLDDGCNRYEFNPHDDSQRHHHLICEQCGKIIEVQIDLLEHLEKKIENKHGFIIKDHRVKFFGICSECK